MSFWKHKHEIERLILEVKKHPLCLTFAEETNTYTVVYPDGSAIGGRVMGFGRERGKAETLERLLELMEADWQASFPAGRAPQ